MEIAFQQPAADVPAILDTAMAAGAGHSLLTYYDDATGERTELSAQALGSWVARTANLLTEGCGLGPGNRAAILLPPHWQTAAVLLGAWSAGVSVAFHSVATAGLPRIGPGADDPIDVRFVALNRLDNWLEDVPEAPHRFVLGLAPDAAPLREVPADSLDYLAEVRDRNDEFRLDTSVRYSDPATTDGTSYAEWGRVAEGIAEMRDLRPGDRVLVDAAEHEHPVKWLLAPLAAGASVVLCANLNHAAVPARTESERVTRVL